MTSISKPDVRTLLTPLLPALPAAALSSQPGPAILPFLSPILRQRVQLLSSSPFPQPWLRLLSYDKNRESRLAEVARSDLLEPHPVSGEVEVDWDYDVQIQYKRIDTETLHSLVILQRFDLFFSLVWCVNDEVGGGDGWRVGEISVPDKSDPFASFAGYSSLEEAESSFRQRNAASQSSTAPIATGRMSEPPLGQENNGGDGGDGDDGEDGYWARYDATPAHTPQVQRSPVSRPTGYQTQHLARPSNADGVDAYYAQYDSVQPATDKHDPEEAQHVAQAAAAVPVPPPLGLQYPTGSEATGRRDSVDASDTNGPWLVAKLPVARSHAEEERTASLAHPRPSSSAGSSRSNTVLKLEEQAGRRESGEFAVKQHVSRTLRSLFLLSRAAGIDRDEFERMVQTELQVLGMVEDDI